MVYFLYCFTHSNHFADAESLQAVLYYYNTTATGELECIIMLGGSYFYIYN